MSDNNLQSTQSKRFMESLSKNSKRLDIAEIKLGYEDMIENKNQRIKALEKKNSHFLEVIAHSNQLEVMNKNEEAINQIQEQYQLAPEVIQEITEVLEMCQNQNNELASQVCFYQNEI
jgi:uncharacterized protein YdcH (DUF465 family)